MFWCTYLLAYIEALALHTGARTVHWEDNTSRTSVVEAKMVTPRVKHTNIPVCVLQEQFDNCLFVPKYEKSSVMPADMCTKTCPVPIISQSTNCMTGLRLYTTSDTKHYQLMILNEFVVN